jgi:hypothetical protein
VSDDLADVLSGGVVTGSRRWFDNCDAAYPTACIASLPDHAIVGVGFASRSMSSGQTIAIDSTRAPVHT